MSWSYAFPSYSFEVLVAKLRERSNRGSIFLLLVLMIGVSALLFVAAVDFRTKLELIRSYDTENEAWRVARVEVDAHQVLHEIDDYILHVDSGKDFRKIITRKFDILYSRIEVIRVSLKRYPASDKLQDHMDRLISWREALAAEIDSGAAFDEGGLRDLRASVDQMLPEIRSFALECLGLFAVESDKKRKEEEGLFFRFYLESIFLLMLMAFGTFLIYQLWRELERRNGQIAQIASSLSAAFDCALNAVIVTDLDCKILYCNAMFGKIFGQDVEKVMGQTVPELILPPELLDAHETEMEKIRAVAPENRYVLGPRIMPARRADGTEITIEVTMMTDRDVSGNGVVVSFMRDITEQLAFEEKLRDAARQAEQAAHAKSMFLATMSHEMRTPLHGLMASLSLVDTSKIDADTKSLLKTANDCSKRALDQINDVLDLTQLGEAAPPREDFSPARIVADIADELRALAEQNENALTLEIAPEVQNQVVRGWPVSFSRAIYNLAGNAVKFTTHGQITIRLCTNDNAIGGGCMTVSVEDTGVGIAPEMQEKIFEAFESAVPIGSRQIGKHGTGLGLAIAQRAVQQQGGQLELESQLGEGSRFYFTIPFAKAINPVLQVGQTAGQPDWTGTGRLNVLVVEDHPVNSALMCRMLERLGHTAECAENGQIAVDKAKLRHFDAILMDFSMPVMDGVTAAQIIREGRGPSANSVIFGVTATSAAANEKLGTIFDKILIKPIGVEKIDLNLRSFRHRFLYTSHALSAVPAAVSAAAVSDLSAMTVLVQDPTFDQITQVMGQETANGLLAEVLQEAAEALKALSDDELTNGEQLALIHKSAGACAMMGLQELAETLSEVETCLRCHQCEAIELLGIMAGNQLNELRKEFAM
ncbi:PAS domain S-box protein [Thalassobius vesicularis]|uniref:histidine kinase n=1 Tax=Thalassobius vesicularis TaxID=1294297 RepID=A0A4S3MAY3_9RHOB|nr:ATP-binding protein [Thalassobius vesicularis]THD73493.1 PAS domain S-box protein [Thalassobius vesicularis]